MKVRGLVFLQPLNADGQPIAQRWEPAGTGEAELVIPDSELRRFTPDLIDQLRPEETT